MSDEATARATAWAAAADLAHRLAQGGISASIARDVPKERVSTMRQFFKLLKQADPEAYSEVICTDHAQHAATGIAEVIGLQADIEAVRARRAPLGDDDPTDPLHAVPTAKGEP